MGVQIRTSGDFETLSEELRSTNIQRLSSFAERYRDRLGDVTLHAHLKLHDVHETAAAECNLNMYTDKGRFHIAEEAFGHDLAFRQALLTLRNRLEKHIEQNALEKTAVKTPTGAHSVSLSR